MARRSSDFLLFLGIGGGAVVLFIFGVWWIVLKPVSERDDVVRPSAASKVVVVPIRNQARGEAVEEEEKREAAQRRRERAQRRLAQQKAILAAEVSDDESATGGVLNEWDNAQELDEELDKVDKNVQRFSEWGDKYETELEGGLLDKEATHEMEADLAKLLSDLPMEAKAEVQCTQSICEVELSSDEPLGRLLPHVGSWVVRYPDRAHGYQKDVGGESSEGLERSPRKGFRLFIDNQMASKKAVEDSEATPDDLLNQPSLL